MTPLEKAREETAKRLTPKTAKEVRAGKYDDCLAIQHALAKLFKLGDPDQ